MKQLSWTFVFIFVLASMALAQTKISGTYQCQKPDPQNVIPMADRANHALEIEQVKCTWAKPFEIGEIASKDGSSWDSGEIDGNTTHFTGFHMSNMANGDQFFVSYRGTGTSKDSKPVSSKGTWWFTGGTGKMKGIKGKGTFTGAPNPDGGNTFEVEGSYTLPAVK
jgi:hypothetical protein